jgi:hypothetical protein
MRVLSTRATGAEAQLSFAGLIDLLDGVTGEELAGLPAPQHRALEVALLRAEPGRAALESGAIAFGFLNALRALSTAGPVLVAVDDVQWLDSPSAEALAFAVPRLDFDAVRALNSIRCCASSAPLPGQAGVSRACVPDSPGGLRPTGLRRRARGSWG